MKRAALGALVCLFIWTAIIPAFAQAAVTIVEVGWWTRQPASQPAPSGGFEVARGPDGDSSLAAIRVRVGAKSLTKAILILNESGGVRQDAAGLKVCPTSAPWSVANPGPMSAAPAAGCDRAKVGLTRDSGSGRWTGDVQLILSDSTNTSLLVLPDVPPGTQVDLGFQVQMANARIDSEGTTGASAGTSDRQTQAQPGSGLAASTTQSADLLLPAPQEPLAEIAAPSISADESVSSRLAAGVPPRAVPRTGGETPWGRLLILIPICVVLGVAAAAVRYKLSGSLESMS